MKMTKKFLEASVSERVERTNAVLVKVYRVIAPGIVGVGSVLDSVGSCFLEYIASVKKVSSSVFSRCDSVTI